MRHGSHHKQGIAVKHVQQKKGFGSLTPDEIRASQAVASVQKGNIAEKVDLKDLKSKNRQQQ